MSDTSVTENTCAQVDLVEIERRLQSGEAIGVTNCGNMIRELSRARRVLIEMRHLLRRELAEAQKDADRYMTARRLAMESRLPQQWKEGWRDVRLLDAAIDSALSLQETSPESPTVSPKSKD